MLNNTAKNYIIDECLKSVNPEETIDILISQCKDNTEINEIFDILVNNSAIPSDISMLAIAKSVDLYNEGNTKPFKELLTNHYNSTIGKIKSMSTNLEFSEYIFDTLLEEHSYTITGPDLIDIVRIMDNEATRQNKKLNVPGLHVFRKFVDETLKEYENETINNDER